MAELAPEIRLAPSRAETDSAGSWLDGASSATARWRISFEGECSCPEDCPRDHDNE